VWDKLTSLAGLDLPGLWSGAEATPSLTDLAGNICRANPDATTAGPVSATGSLRREG
jgi:hypothetical protein